MEIVSRETELAHFVGQCPEYGCFAVHKIVGPHVTGMRMDGSMEVVQKSWCIPSRHRRFQDQVVNRSHSPVAFPAVGWWSPRTFLPATADPSDRPANRHHRWSIFLPMTCEKTLPFFAKNVVQSGQKIKCSRPSSCINDIKGYPKIQWLNLPSLDSRENLQETIDGPIKYEGFLSFLPEINPLMWASIHSIVVSPKENT